MRDLPEHVRRNRTVWDDWARTYVAAGEAARAQDSRVRSSLGVGRPMEAWDSA